MHTNFYILRKSLRVIPYNIFIHKIPVDKSTCNQNVLRYAYSTQVVLFYVRLQSITDIGTHSSMFCYDVKHSAFRWVKAEPLAVQAAMLSFQSKECPSVHG
jgi:hypothetical protein